MKTDTLRNIDNLFGKLLCSIVITLCNLKRKKQVKINKQLIKKFLVIRPGGIGDIVCALPFLKKLRKEFPKSNIQVLAMQRNKGILKDNPWINKLIIFNENKAINPFYLIGILRELRNESFDIVFDLEQSHRFPAIMSYFTNSKIRIGYATNERKYFYTHQISYSQDRYEVLSFLEQLKVLNIKIDKNDTKLEMPLKKEKNKFIGKITKLRENNKLIALAPAASRKEKKWPPNNFVDLINRLLENKNKLNIILIGNKEDKKEVSQILEKINKSYLSKIYSVAGKTDLLQTAEILKYCNLFIGSDTGPLHIAAAVNIPTISFFGSTIEKKWAPKGKKHKVLNKHLHCSPCSCGLFSYIPKCKYDVKCMKEIKPVEVLKEINKLI